MEGSRRKKLLEWGTFLVAFLTYVAPLGNSVLGVRTAQVVATLFVLYLVVPAGLRAASDEWRRRGRTQRLGKRWPAFRARVTSFREFFAPDHASSLATAIERTGKKPAEYVHVLKIQDFVALMDSLSFNVSQDAERMPTWSEAKRVVRDFENLLPLLESRGVRSLLELTDAKLDQLLARYTTFRQSYREFAIEANVFIGEDLFNGAR